MIDPNPVLRRNIGRSTILMADRIDSIRPAFSGSPLCALEAHEAVSLLKKREISPGDLLDAALSRIGTVEPLINAMPIVCESRARRHSRDVTACSLLAGLPIAIKDLSAVAGVRSTWGSWGLKDFVPAVSDPIVERLENNGGIVAGKTNTPEMGAGGNTFNAVFGATRNPWDIRKNAGGSSGGAAASLASGEIWLSHGSDHGGSLRTPAAYCGIVGLRPSPGRAGGGPQAISFNQEAAQGPMARTVTDLALFLDAMTGFDPREPLTFDAPAEPFRAAVARADHPVRIAYTPDLNGFAEVEPGIDAVLRGALGTMERHGAVLAMACPDLPALNETYLTLRAMSQAALPGRAPEGVQAHYKATLRDNITAGRTLTAESIYDAQRGRAVLFARMERFLRDFDVLACPAVGLAPLDVEIEYPTEVNGKPMADYVEWLRFAFLATATGLPALVLPVGFTAEGMPVGIQLIGRPRGEARLLQVGRAFEMALGALGKMPIDPVVKP